MDLKELRERGGFVSATPIKKHVTWKYTHKETGEDMVDDFDVFVMQVSFAESSQILSLAGNLENYPEKERQGRQNAALVSTCCRFGEKLETLEFEEAMRADTQLMAVLSRAVTQVIYPKKKPSRKTRRSGSTSSAPESAAAQSKKPSKN